MESRYKDFFKNKKITVLGVGILGRGVGDVRFFAECGADILVTDLKNREELRGSLNALKEYKNITYVLGEHRLADFKDKDLVIKAAGVPLDSPFVAEARKNKIPVEMSTALFVKLLPPDVFIVGVTGTRGKSTVAHLIFHILQKAGKRVFLGGNVAGVSTLELLKKVRSRDGVVLELDSWQLQGFGEAKISPHTAVFTNFLDDHLNYYESDRSRYLDDKANIFKFQREENTIILGKQCAALIQEKYPNIKSTIVIADKKDIPQNWKITLPGEHNKDNAACAIAVAHALGVSDGVIQQALTDFNGVSGRLELISEIKGVKIYNDTTATTPDATMAALKALSSRLGSGQNQNNRIVLILGGSDKGLDMSKLAEEIPKYCKTVILLPGTGTDNFRFKISDLRLKNIIIETKTLKEAVVKGIGVAKSGDILLFSPAFASFGLFKNEFDRGDQFNEMVQVVGKSGSRASSCF